MREIKEWNYAQISQYFNVCETRSMQEQSWLSRTALHNAELPATKGPIPRMELADDGTRSALVEVMSGPLARPSFHADIDPKPTLTEWPNTYTYLDFHQPVTKECATEGEIRNTPDLRHRAAKLDQLIFNLNRPEILAGERQPAVVNFLDIPLSSAHNIGLPTEGIDSFPVLQSSNDARHVYATELPHTDYKWGLAASAGAVSASHMDAAGFGTSVRMLLGQKIWILMIPDSTAPHMTVASGARDVAVAEAVSASRKRVRKTGKLTKNDIVDDFPEKRKDMVGNEAFPHVSVLDGFKEQSLRPVAILMEPGDDLYVIQLIRCISLYVSLGLTIPYSIMQPGTIHAVYSSQPALAYGGHFICPGTLAQTMYALAVERFTGYITTNTDHSTCGVAFIRQLQYVNEALIWEQERKATTHGSMDTINRPTDVDIAHLVVIVSYLDQLAPAVANDTTTENLEASEDEGLYESTEGKNARKAASTRWVKQQRRVKAGQTGKPFTWDGQSVHVAQHFLPLVWQETKAFQHDHGFAMKELVPELVEHLANETILDEILLAEDTLLQYAANFAKEFAAAHMDLAPIHPCSVLDTLVQGARKSKNMPKEPPVLEEIRRSRILVDLPTEPTPSKDATSEIPFVSLGDPVTRKLVPMQNAGAGDGGGDENQEDQPHTEDGMGGDQEGEEPGIIVATKRKRGARSRQGAATAKKAKVQ